MYSLRLTDYGLMMSQNGMFAAALEPFGSADVPGLNAWVSPAVLNDAAWVWAVLIACVFVPHRAVSQAEKLPMVGIVPKAEAFSSAASNCCKSCILAWSSAVRDEPLDFFEMLAQKPPISFPSVSM